jgi:hypothetical protein
MKPSDEWKTMSMEERHAFLCCMEGQLGAQITYLFTVGVPVEEVHLSLRKIIPDALTLATQVNAAA